MNIADFCSMTKLQTVSAPK